MRDFLLGEKDHFITVFVQLFRSHAVLLRLLSKNFKFEFYDTAKQNEQQQFVFVFAIAFLSSN